MVPYFNKLPDAQRTLAQHSESGVDAAQAWGVQARSYLHSVLRHQASDFVSECVTNDTGTYACADGDVYRDRHECC